MTTTDAEHRAAKTPLSRRARRRSWKRTVIDRSAQEAFSKDSRWVSRDDGKRRNRRRLFLVLGGALFCGLAGAILGAVLEVETQEIIVPDFPEIHAAANRFFPEALPERTQVSVPNSQTLQITLAIPRHARGGLSSSHDPIDRLSGSFAGEVAILNGQIIKTRIEAIIAQISLPITARCYTYADGVAEGIKGEGGATKALSPLTLTLQERC